MQFINESDENEIKINFFPFLKRKVNRKEVKCAKIVNYCFLGGWGIWLGTKYDVVYNTTGNKGLAIELQNGKNF